MKRVAGLLIAAGAAAGIGGLASATTAEAGGWCPPGGYAVVYYMPAPCCTYSHFGYTKTTQYWPVVHPYRYARVVSYPPIRARRR